MNPAWNETVRLRAQLHAGGWRVVPLAEDAKAPLFADWPKFVYRPDDPEPPIPRTFNKEGKPTALAHKGTGAITIGVVAIDFDVEDPDRARAARIAFEAVAGASPVARMRADSPRRMLFYRPGEGVKAISASVGEDPAKIEIFGDHDGRQVMLFGRHPKGAMLEYEGDDPTAWPLAELPAVDRPTLNAAFGAALDAAGIPRDGKAADGAATRESVRRQSDADAATKALGEELRRILTGESVHRASNAAADVMAFQLDLDAEQGARILAAVAMAAADVNPAEIERYRELFAKAISRARWYAERAEAEPEDPVKATFWRAARVRRFKREWRVLPADLQAQFLDAAKAAGGR